MSSKPAHSSLDMNRLLLIVAIGLIGIPTVTAQEYKDANSRPLSVFVHFESDAPTFPDANSRALAVFVHVETEFPSFTDANSRAVSLFLDYGTLNPSYVDANSRAISLFVERGPERFTPLDAVSHEASLYVPPYELPEAADALRYAAGLMEWTSTAGKRLDLQWPATPNGITFDDAVRIIRLSVGLDRWY